MNDADQARADRDDAQRRLLVVAKGTVYWKMRADHLTAWLRKYGDHKYGCAMSRYLREYDSTQILSVRPTCDCGWAEFALTIIKENI